MLAGAAAFWCSQKAKPNRCLPIVPSRLLSYPTILRTSSSATETETSTSAASSYPPPLAECVIFAYFHTPHMSSSGAVTVTSCGSDQSEGRKVRLAGLTVTTPALRVHEAPSFSWHVATSSLAVRLTVTFPVGWADSLTV